MKVFNFYYCLMTYVHLYVTVNFYIDTFISQLLILVTISTMTGQM
jgi:hypothetical protein